MWPSQDLEPGVKFFVLMIEQLGGKTLVSCEGHPIGFYIGFIAAYETAIKIRKAGYFDIIINDFNSWLMCMPGHCPPKSIRDRNQTLRWSAEAWEIHFGKLKALENK